MVAAMTVSVVKRNIIANTVGGIWLILIGLFIIPVQYKLLGAEVLGLLGFIASLQLIFAIFDFGLATTVLRVIASDSSPNYKESRELIQMASLVYWLVAVLLGLGLCFAAQWISESWLTLEELTPDYAANIIYLLAITLFSSWALPLYGSILAGLQRLEVTNILQIVTATVNNVGSIIILLVTGNLYAFLIWRILNNLMALVLYIAACYRYFPGFSLIPKFSLAALQRTWRFSLNMNAISILSVVYTQTDRLLMSWLLPVAAIGYFNGAYGISTKGIVSFQGIFGSAMLPALAEDYGNKRLDLMYLRFNKYTQLLTYLSALPTFLFIFFGYDVLRVWTTVEVAEAATIAFALISFGFFLNSIVSTFYIITVATDNTHLPLILNIVGIAIYLPTLYFLVLEWGINGAALAWLLLNLYYLIVFVPLVSWQIMKMRIYTWLLHSFLPFLAIGCLFAVARQAITFAGLDNSMALWFICAITSAAYLLLGYFFLEVDIREDVQKILIQVSAKSYNRIKHFRQ
jgi:O-antigen/teichoic acid export membrane protein